MCIRDRLNIITPTNNGGTTARIYEFEVYGALVTAPNLALTKLATSSTACSTTEAAAKAVDGTTTNNSKWCSLAASKWLQVDLGSNATITSFTLRHAGAGGESTSFNTRDFSIQLSSDGSTWSTPVNVSANTASVTSHPIASTSARYVRLVITTGAQSGQANTARIYELEVYGATATATPTPGPQTACWTAYVADAIYVGGAQVSYGGRNWTAKWWIQYEAPSTGGTGVWTDNGPCGGSPSPTSVPPTATPAAQLLFAENFEDGPWNWAINPRSLDTASSGQWAVGTPQPTNLNGPKQLAAANGTQALATGLSAGNTVTSGDVDGGMTSADMSTYPPVAVGVQYTLTFKYYFAHGADATSDDVFRIKVGSSGGVATANQVIFERRGSATDVDAAWQSVSVNFTVPVDGYLYLTVETIDGGTESLIETGIDDLEIRY